MLRLSGPACVLVFCGILIAGLWPFQSPVNGVHWLSGTNGLRFERHGTAIGLAGSSPIAPAGSVCSIELWLKPARRSDSKTILTFYAPRDVHSLEFSQSLTDIYMGHGPAARRRDGLYLPELCRAGQPLFLTISPGPEGSTIYVDGSRVRMARGFSVTGADCRGRLILGTAPFSDSGWSGDLLGLALYAGTLSPESVTRHYRTWTQQGRPDLAASDDCAALYTFDERTGSVAHSHCGAQSDLVIPERYTILDQSFLMPFWDAVDVPDMIRNLAAFIPLGFFLRGYLANARPAWATAAAVTVAGGLLSLTIEILQSHLPTRQSDSMDLLMNTAGTLAGAVLCRRYLAA